MSDDGRFVARDLHRLLHCDGGRVVWYIATRLLRVPFFRLESPTGSRPAECHTYWHPAEIHDHHDESHRAAWAASEGIVILESSYARIFDTT